MILTRVVIFTTQFPFHGLRDSGIERSGEEGGRLRNVVTVMYEYWEGKKCYTRQDPEREPR